MNTSHPAYITVDIPEPINSNIREMRRKYGNVYEQIPVEITIAGSSGVGPIAAGTPLDLIYSEVDRLSSELSSFQMSFRELTKFPNTFLSYLKPTDRTIFDHWHRLFTSSNLPFSNNPFPYNPHCTIRTFPNEEMYEAATHDPFPQEIFDISTISVYDLCKKTVCCSLLHRVKLSKNEK